MLAPLHCFCRSLETYLLGLGVLLLGKKLVGERSLQILLPRPFLSILNVLERMFKSYLESSSQTEDAVVCLLGRKTLEGKQDSLGLFGDQIIGPANESIISRAPLQTQELIWRKDRSRREWQSQSVALQAACLEENQSYLKPSCLYPAALPYQLAIGIINLFSQGRLRIWFVRDGADIVLSKVSSSIGPVCSRMNVRVTKCKIA